METGDSGVPGPHAASLVEVEAEADQDLATTHPHLGEVKLVWAYHLMPRIAAHKLVLLVRVQELDIYYFIVF